MMQRSFARNVANGRIELSFFNQKSRDVGVPVSTCEVQRRALRVGEVGMDLHVGEDQVDCLEETHARRIRQYAWGVFLQNTTCFDDIYKYCGYILGIWLCYVGSSASQEYTMFNGMHSTSLASELSSLWIAIKQDAAN